MGYNHLQDQGEISLRQRGAGNDVVMIPAAYVSCQHRLTRLANLMYDSYFVLVVLWAALCKRGFFG